MANSQNEGAIAVQIFLFGTRDSQAYLYAPPRDIEHLVPDPPRSLIAGWSVPSFELVKEDELRSFLPTSDFPTLLPSTPILSARAARSMGEIIEASGELLPISLSNSLETFLLFNVTLVVNAINMQRSDFMRFSDGRIMKYDRLVFDPAKVPDKALFFKTTQLGPAVEIFVTERAARIIETSGLSGCDFCLAGTDN